ncbi:hypothetical protein [Algoriphagus pacificus]|uniref:Lipocalin-like domain-containing protein n=1 Tax=Algoriphagus pacificus TaxID=2811234 RepID=A0ABS3CLG6_9BACT|nr:hypothetical protein [Algoriphagus pacificus]MBN7817927.1 hypothetical protein [Algoriphagus pacificus]
MKLSKFKILMLLLSLAVMQSCGDDAPKPVQKTAEELAIEALTGTGTLTWGVSGGGSVKRDGTTVTDLYQNFELILNAGSSKTYSSKNNNDLFDASGTWLFAGSNFDKFTLSGSKPAATREISFTRTGDNLKLLFTIPAPGARINGVFAVAGSYEFNLLKK